MIEAATPIPALPPGLRELGGAFVGSVGGEKLDAGRIEEMVEDVDALVEVDMVELDAARLVRDCGEGA